MKFLQKITGKKEKGQIIVFLALIMIGLVAVIGLSIDLGYVYVSYSRLRRAVDSAALAATNEFRRNYTIANLRTAAQQMLNLNQIVVDNPSTDILIQNCDTNPTDLELCPYPRRKLVRITVTQKVPLFFLGILGFQYAPITVSTVSEAASVDVVLVIDSSESMTWDAASFSQARDPYFCNQTNNCHPFQEVKNAAKSFADIMFYPYDRVSVVTFNQKPHMVLEMSSDNTAIDAAIDSLKVYEGGDTANGVASLCPYFTDQPPSSLADLGSPCRLYDKTYPASTAKYYGFDCPNFPFNYPDGAPNVDYSKCTSTNIGGGLLYAGNALGGTYPPGFAFQNGGTAPPNRQESLWVVILLTDGSANAGQDSSGNFICPRTPVDRAGNHPPYCVDTDVTAATRHIATTVGSVTTYPLAYDTYDYAQDMVDFVAKGQGALVFTIGLGNLVNYNFFETDAGKLAPGVTLLNYAATQGNGLYYYSPGGSQLNAVFLAIANKIATRLTK